ncbi:MAG: hypothetical protein PCFJNLEI_03263 [Verrucomicrobiae bacterium]|nr:hypothetical protein [Verrucomicrobiae bacterium]
MKRASIKRSNEVIQSAESLVVAYRDQIEEHRRAVSLEVGGDVGYDWAVAEWLEKNVPAWRELQWERLARQSMRDHFRSLADRAVK